jgi:SAM-dependent methyltransferase
VRFLITDTYYPRFLEAVYTADPSLRAQPYDRQLRVLLDRCFGTSDFYSWNLRTLGHEAVDVVSNCLELQSRWARERYGVLVPRRRGLLHILRSQIESFRPDVLYVQNVNWPDASFYRGLRHRPRLIVGQTAYPLLPSHDYGAFDLILTSFPHYVQLFRSRGLASEYVPLAFDPRVLERIDHVSGRHGAVFVGSFTGRHAHGTALLERVAQRAPIDVWGHGLETLAPESPLRDRYRGEAFGLAMYQVLASARIAINRHIGVAGRNANNLRLFEATGVGTCLLTDAKDNLGELFDVGAEVACYRDADECADLVLHYLDREDEREALARAGQARTLREHTYEIRMAEVAEHVRRHLDHRHQGRRPVYLIPPAETSTVRKAAATVTPLAARLPAPVKRALARATQYAVRRNQPAPSVDHRVISGDRARSFAGPGWQDPAIPTRQRALVDAQLLRMYLDDPPTLFKVAAETLRDAGLPDATVVEVGCASGYYYEALSHLLGRRISYVGLELSQPLLEQARARYPEVPFLRSDATRLPLGSGSCGVVFSAGVLLHVTDYAAAIVESARVAERWCIFHRTPLVRTGSTTFLSKLAYGVDVVELVFSEAELLEIFDGAGLRLERRVPIETYAVSGVCERVFVETLVCRK